jgi:hypothetical protein
MRGIAKIDKYGFGMANVEVAIGLWWKTTPYFTVGCCEMSFPKGRPGLGIFARFMQRPKKSFFKNRLSGNN